MPSLWRTLYSPSQCPLRSSSRATSATTLAAAGARNSAAPRPTISAWLQPCSCSAPRFQCVMRPPGSVATTATSTCWSNAAWVVASCLASSCSVTSCVVPRTQTSSPAPLRTARRRVSSQNGPDADSWRCRRTAVSRSPRAIGASRSSRAVLIWTRASSASTSVWKTTTSSVSGRHSQLPSRATSWASSRRSWLSARRPCSRSRSLRSRNEMTRPLIEPASSRSA